MPGSDIRKWFRALIGGMFTREEIDTAVDTELLTPISQAMRPDQSGQINDLTNKASPVAGDLFMIEDSEDSNSKKKVQLGSLPGGGNDAFAIHDNVAAEISAITEKTNPVSADLIVIEDSADSNNKKRVQLSNLPGGPATSANNVIVEARKASPGTINPTEVVYTVGWDATEGVVTVELADASSSATMPALGFARTTFTDSTTGTITVLGTCLNHDTSSFSSGDPVYTSETPGEYTITKPTGTALVQKLGEVARVHATLGTIQVSGAGRSNDLPNLAQGNVWVGDSNGVPAAQTLHDVRDQIVFDHFMSSNDDSDEIGQMSWREFGSGTGSSIAFSPAVAGHPGILQINGGTGGTARRGIGLGDSSGTGGRIVVGGTNQLVYETLVRFPNATDFIGANLEQAMFGFGLDWGGDTEIADGIYFRFDPVADTNWVIVCANGGTRTVVDLSTAPAAGTWVRFGFTATASSVQGIVNGINAGAAIATNIPTTGVGVGFKVRSGGGSSAELNVDYVSVSQVTDKEG